MLTYNYTYGDPIPNRQIKFFAIAILGSTVKFNSCQYFRLYGIIVSEWGEIADLAIVGSRVDQRRRGRLW